MGRHRRGLKILAPNRYGSVDEVGLVVIPWIVAIMFQHGKIEYPVVKLARALRQLKIEGQPLESLTQVERSEVLRGGV